jgi:hypothetical protein
MRLSRKFYINLENKRHGRGREIAQNQYRVYCLGRSHVEGDSRKRARAHCHTQAWPRYDIGASGKVPGRSLKDIVAGHPRKRSSLVLVCPTVLGIYPGR